MTRIVFAIVLLTVLFGAAQPVLAAGPVVEFKQVYVVQQPVPQQHAVTPSHDGKPAMPPPFQAHLPMQPKGDYKPILRPCSQICIQ